MLNYSPPLLQLRVPPHRIERHASEPAPSTSIFIRHVRQPHQQDSPANPGLAVPPQSPHLVKQHSHPLLPSQMASCSPITVQRQLSQPGQRPSRVSLHHRLPMHSSLDSATPLLNTEQGSSSSSYSVSEAGCTRGTPPSIHIQGHTPPSTPLASGGGTQSPHLSRVDEGRDLLALPSHLNQLAAKRAEAGTSAATPPMLIVSGPATGSLDYAPALRVKDELQRSISTPQVC